MRIRAGGGISSFSQINMAGPIYDQYGNLILGGGTGTINYVDLTYRPSAPDPNPPIYNDFNILYSAIQSNTTKSIITRLWLDDSLTQIIIPAGSDPWDFSMVEVYRLTGTYSNVQFAFDCTLLNTRKFENLNLSLTADSQIAYSNASIFYFVNTTIDIDQVLTADSPIFITEGFDAYFIFDRTDFQVDITTNYNYFNINSGTNFLIQNGSTINNIFYTSTPGTILNATFDDTSTVNISNVNLNYTPTCTSNAINVNYNDSLVTPPLSATNVQSAIDKLKQQTIPAVDVSYNDSWQVPPLGASDVQHAIDALKTFPNFVESIKIITVDNSIGSSTYPILKTLAETVAIVTANAGDIKYLIKIISTETLNSNVYNYGVPNYPILSGIFESSDQDVVHQINMTTGGQIFNIDNFNYLTFNFGGAPSANVFSNGNGIYEWKYCLFEGDQTTTLMPNTWGTFIFYNCTFGVFNNSYVFANITQNSTIIFNNTYVQTNLRFNITNCTANVYIYGSTLTSVQLYNIFFIAGTGVVNFYVMAQGDTILWRDRSGTLVPSPAIEGNPSVNDAIAVLADSISALPSFNFINPVSGQTFNPHIVIPSFLSEKAKDH